MPDLVAGAFLRPATNLRVFLTPTSLDDAFGYLRALRGQPGHLTPSPGAGHLAVLERLCRAADAVGDLVPDAQLAAIAVEHGGEVVSFDRDLARFGDLRWLRPGEALRR